MTPVSSLQQPSSITHISESQGLSQGLSQARSMSSTPSQSSRRRQALPQPPPSSSSSHYIPLRSSSFSQQATQIPQQQNHHSQQNHPFLHESDADDQPVLIARIDGPPTATSVAPIVLSDANKNNGGVLCGVSEEWRIRHDAVMDDVSKRVEKCPQETVTLMQDVMETRVRAPLQERIETSNGVMEAIKRDTKKIKTAMRTMAENQAQMTLLLRDSIATKDQLATTQPDLAPVLDKIQSHMDQSMAQMHRKLREDMLMLEQRMHETIVREREPSFILRHLLLLLLLLLLHTELLRHLRLQRSERLRPVMRPKDRRRNSAVVKRHFWKCPI